jgi:hypothetical protein
MNSPADFDALTCSRKKKGEIAMMLQVWNESIYRGGFSESHHQGGGILGINYYAKVRTAAKKVGLMVGTIPWNPRKI